MYMEVSTKYLFNISLGIIQFPVIPKLPWHKYIPSLQFLTLSKLKTCSKFYINITDIKTKDSWHFSIDFYINVKLLADKK